MRNHTQITQIMKLKISQYDVEGKLNNTLSFGDETKIAEKLGCSPTYISQQCNPHEDRKSDFYKAICFIAALCEIDAERGRAALNLFTQTVERHLPADLGDDYERSITAFNTELSQFQTATSCGKDAETCIRELDDVVSKLVTLREQFRRKATFERAKSRVSGVN